MDRRTLGNTGLRVFPLGFGAEPIGRRGLDIDAAASVLNAVLDEGLNLVDTASAYGDSEDFIGQSIVHRRDDFILVTKCGWTDDWQPARSPPEIAATVDRSLRRLRVDHVDVLLLHGSPLDELKAGDSIEALHLARRQGKARFIGLSDDNDSLAWAIEHADLDVIEASFNLCDQANAPAIAAADRQGLGVLIKRSIANAVPGRQTKPESPYARQYWPRWQALGLADADIAGLNWPEAALRFAAFTPGVHVALTGSVDIDHIRENVRFINNGPLDEVIAHRFRDAFTATGADWPALQ